MTVLLSANRPKPALLVINSGSSSIKFAVYELDQRSLRDSLCFQGQVSGIGGEGHFSVHQINPVGDPAPPRHDKRLALPHHDAALGVIMQWLQDHAAELRLVAVGHRILHGGRRYLQSVILHAEQLAELDQLIPLAPLHQPHNLAGVRSLMRLHPALVHVGCFDTAFHRTMPESAQEFALPQALTEGEIRRYGFHGLSYEYIATVLPDYLAAGADGRVIVAHLGHGASMCALRRRQSVATTMSFTPLDGLPMGTRCGSIDPAVVLYLMREKNMSLQEVSHLLERESGWLGMSGISADMQTLLASDQFRARRAVSHFIYAVNRELGSLAAALRGVDALVFTAGIGEHAVDIRARVCESAAWLGIELDVAANARHGPRISSDASRVSVWVIPTDEQLVIAGHSRNLLQQQGLLTPAAAY